MEQFLTPSEIEFMKHTLGLTRNKKAYRNRFCGKDTIGDVLAEKGFANSWIPAGDNQIWYSVNKQGTEMLQQYIGKFKILD